MYQQEFFAGLMNSPLLVPAYECSAMKSAVYSYIVFQQL